jgi:hypothetical protein
MYASPTFTDRKKFIFKFIYFIIINMDQILNPFDKINPFQIKPSDYLQFKKLIITIKEKELLIEIGGLLEKRLKDLN